MEQFLDCECCQTDIDERNLIRILNEESELSDKKLCRLKSALEKSACGKSLSTNVGESILP